MPEVPDVDGFPKLGKRLSFYTEILGVARSDTETDFELMASRSLENEKGDSVNLLFSVFLCVIKLKTPECSPSSPPYSSSTGFEEFWNARSERLTASDQLQ